LVQIKIRFNRILKKIRKMFGRFWCRASQGKFNRILEKKRWEASVQSQVHQDSGEGMGGFGAEPGQIHQGSGKNSARLWCNARSNSLNCATI
jgi:hypothetical protein